MSGNKITKAVFPVAGLGTRFLPVTKANPKEMLPIVDKPLIQYAVEEAISAGIDELIFVTSSKKRAIEDHFDRDFELEAKLAERDQQVLLQMMKTIIPARVSCVYIRQNETLGLGHAVACAAKVIGDEAFAVLLADDFIMTETQNCIQQMLSVYEKTNSSVLAVQQVAPAEVNKYGIVATTLQHKLHYVNDIIEKPDPEQAPSNLAVVGRYILTPAIFTLLKSTLPGKNAEIQLTDAIAKLLTCETVVAYPYQGTRFDCGTKLGYLQAIINEGIRHPEVGPMFQTYLQQQALTLT